LDAGRQATQGEPMTTAHFKLQRRRGVPCVVTAVFLAALGPCLNQAEALSEMRQSIFSSLPYTGPFAVVSVVRQLDASETKDVYMFNQEYTNPWYGHEARIERSYPEISTEVIWIIHEGQSHRGDSVSQGKEEYLSAAEIGRRYFIYLPDLTPHEYGISAAGEKVPIHNIANPEQISEDGTFTQRLQVPPVGSMHRNIPLDAAWRLLVRSFDRMHEADGGSTLDVAKQLDIAQSGTPMEASLALAHLYVTEGDPLTPSRLLAIVETRYQRLLNENADAPREDSNFSNIEGWSNLAAAEETAFLRELAYAGLRLSIRDASEAEIEEWYAFFAADLQDINAQVLLGGNRSRTLLPLVSLLLRLPPETRLQRLQELVSMAVPRYSRVGHEVETRRLLSIDNHLARAFAGRFAEDTSEDAGEIFNMILESPEYVGLSKEWLAQCSSNDGRTYAVEFRDKRKKALDLETRLDVSTYLDEFISELEASIDGEKPFHHGLMRIVRYLANKEDKRLLPIFLSMDRLDNEAQFIRWKLKDPSLVPGLRANVEWQNWSSPVLQAMYVCGAKEEAMAHARITITSELEKAPPDRNMRLLSGCIAFFGEFGEVTDRELLRNIVTSPNPDSSARYYALLALARLKGIESMPLLRDWYAVGNSAEKSAAAVALWYLGDETGKPLLDAYADGPTSTTLFPIDYEGPSGITSSILYLRSKRTDQIAMRRIKRGIVDYAYMYDLAFMMEHAGTVLPIAAHNRYPMLHKRLDIGGIKSFFGGTSHYTTPGYRRGPMVVYRPLISSYLSNWEAVETSSSEY
jgi:hypothetical protein